MFSKKILDLGDHFDQLRSSRKRSLPQTARDRAIKRKQLTRLELGHHYMRTVRKYMTRYDEGDHPRTPDQILIQERCLAALARYCYGEELAANELEIKRVNGFTDVKQEVLITAARRVGKSMIIAMLMAAILNTFPRVEICIFASGSRAAGGTMGLMGLVKMFLTKYYDYTNFEKSTDQHLYVEVGPSDVRKMHAFPGSVDT